jgi:hypothetical protein
LFFTFHHDVLAALIATAHNAIGDLAQPDAHQLDRLVQFADKCAIWYAAVNVRRGLVVARVEFNRLDPSAGADADFIWAFTPNPAAVVRLPAAACTVQAHRQS